MTPILATDRLSRSFGGLRAVNEVTFSLAPGARQALIGPNGAGKTTFVNILTGVIAPSFGSIRLAGEDITRLSRHQRVRRGMVRTFQVNQLFPDLTPLESVLLAIFERDGKAANLRRPAWREEAAAEEAAAILARLKLADVMDLPTAEIAYGKRRQLEIAVALACRPKLLLLDEPAAGVPDGERQDIMAAIAALPRDVAVLLIEHDMDLVFRFAERIAVLVGGTLLVEDVPERVAADPRVREAYLGESLDGRAA
ncbi:ABC transporter ATP-binding protein [Propylenella binzhouense]|uniref:ABC transporter ATP-binding protein n=1 Tax=Propylenella binzhouense TaxID=2555902 RepID=A0A964T5C7_9HYPH|nr:ABC transporter ATP-binding protein [Propylenella binzhouense]MYZ48818.1 ABC transporter ATP-binding protein [Propylenella binzhouense]